MGIHGQALDIILSLQFQECSPGTVGAYNLLLFMAESFIPRWFVLPHKEQTYAMVTQIVGRDLNLLKWVR
jgi:hypothetical protein